MDKKKIFLAYAQAIKELGYKVYVVNRTYGWVVNDKDEIGYFQLDDFGHGIIFSTIHKPCETFGNGFSLDSWDNYHTTFTKEIVDRCFMHHPAWARGDASKIQKYTATEYFANYWDKKNVVEL